MQHVHRKDLALGKLALREVPLEIIDAAGNHERLEGDIAGEAARHRRRRIHVCGIDQHKPVTGAGIWGRGIIRDRPLIPLVISTPFLTSVTPV